MSTWPSANGWTYDGNSHALLNAGSGSGGTMKYKLSGGNYSTSIPSATNAGTYTLYYYVEGDSNHNNTSSHSINVTVNRASGWVSLSSSSGSLYANNTTTFTASGSGSLSVSSSNTSVAYASINNGTVTVTGVGAGSATITVTAAATTNYNSASASYSVTVESGFTYRISNWGNSYGNKVGMECPTLGQYGTNGNYGVDGTTDGNLLYVATTVADGRSWTSDNCWVELRLPAGTYRAIMRHTTSSASILDAIIWTGSSWGGHAGIANTQDTLPGSVSSNSVWLDPFTLTETTNVRFRETNQSGGYSQAVVWLIKVK